MANPTPVPNASGFASQWNIGFKPIFHWKLGLRWLPNANEINTKKHAMYMANAKKLCLVPNTTYIPLTRVGVFIGLPNAKDTNMLVSFALGDAKVPNANGCASQWNI